MRSPLSALALPVGDAVKLFSNACVALLTSLSCDEDGAVVASDVVA